MAAHTAVIECVLMLAIEESEECVQYSGKEHEDTCAKLKIYGDPCGSMVQS
jgi:hypothetical protein